MSSSPMRRAFELASPLPALAPLGDPAGGGGHLPLHAALHQAAQARHRLVHLAQVPLSAIGDEIGPEMALENSGLFLPWWARQGRR